MDSVKSFKGYGKVDPVADEEFRRKSRRRFLIIVLSAVFLVAIVIGAVAGTLVHRSKSSSPAPASNPSAGLTPAASLKTVCDATLHPASCYSSISALAASHTTNPKILFKLSLQVAFSEIEKVSKYVALLANKTADKQLNKALNVCEDLFDDAIDRFNESISSVEVNQAGENFLSSEIIDDIKTWLSTSITDQETCIDALQEMNATILPDVKNSMQNSTIFASNSLAIVAKVLAILADYKMPGNRKLLGFGGIGDEFPGWLSAGDRRLLQDSDLEPNVTVARDGTGTYKTIKEAVAAAPKKSVNRFAIYVKEGEYIENVVLDKNKWNVMMLGDGKGKTIVSGSLNFVDGTPTFATATVAVAGRGFIAKDMSFMNKAGARKHQAVAFRSGSDRSVFYRCEFNAFQDTLYAHSNRQFYRECDITGTIDFIFGNAAVVFQRCNIQPIQPLPNQFNTITAQGKKDPNQETGISIQKCEFSAPTNLTAATYLGRPWKEFSTTVIMQSKIGSFLKPEGWREWVPGVKPPSTIFYAEYQNSGPGADVSKRVTWVGYRSTLSDVEASKFTVGTFIQGTEWLTEANVAFDTAL